MDNLIQTRRPDPVLIKKKKRTGCLVDFAIQVDRWVEIKESEKIIEYLDFAREHDDDGDNKCN